MRELDVGGGPLRRRHLPVRLDRLPADATSGVLAALARRAAAPRAGRRARGRVPARARDAACTPRRCACGAGTPATAASSCASPRRRLDVARRLMHVDYELVELARRRQLRALARAPDQPLLLGREMRALMDAAGLAVRALVPAYADGGEIDADTFHVLALARAGARVKVAVVLTELDPRLGRRLHLPGDPRRGASSGVAARRDTSSSSTRRGEAGPRLGAAADRAAGALAAAPRASACTRDVQDARSASGRCSGRTWFERSLAQRGDRPRLVRTTHAEDCRGLPFVFTVFDLEHRSSRGSRR